jgi:hypothetical protein
MRKTDLNAALGLLAAAVAGYAIAAVVAASKGQGSAVAPWPTQPQPMGLTLNLPSTVQVSQ